MNLIANARLQLTQCKSCLGCNRLEEENFKGDNQCKYFKDGVADEKPKSIRPQTSKVNENVAS